MTKFIVQLRSIDKQPDIESFLFRGIRSLLTHSIHPFELAFSVQPILYKAFRYQILLVQEALLHFLVVSALVEYQQIYFMEINPSKTSNHWGIQLITRLCTLIQNNWIHNNSILHETEVTAELSGVEELKTAIQKDYEIGLGEFPSVYTSYFLPPIPFILEDPTA